MHRVALRNGRALIRREAAQVFAKPVFRKYRLYTRNKHRQGNRSGMPLSQ